MLDVRPVTLTYLSTSKDPRMATNAVSYGQEDGGSFIAEKPAGAKTIPAQIRFKKDRLLADGVLFTPTVMEEKWALFHRDNRIICVCSWLRQVLVDADVDQAGDTVCVTALRGHFVNPEEPPELTIKTLDFLLRSHALGTVSPVPLPEKEVAEKAPYTAALWCMNAFGKLAHYATPYEAKLALPDKPIRTHSLLHIAVARGDVQAIDKQLQAGIPIDLLAADGLAPMHWALASDILKTLLERGAAVDSRSAEGATSLMNAVQAGNVEQTTFLLDHGADPNAADLRGFTALHRAAEMGKLPLVELLLARGASSKVEAQGHTPLSLAEQRGERAVVELLKKH